MTSASSSIVRTTHMTGCATDVGLIFGRVLGRALRRREPRGFTTPEVNRLGLYGRLSSGFVLGAAAGTALVLELELDNARALFVPAFVVFVVGLVAGLGLFGGPDAADADADAASEPIKSTELVAQRARKSSFGL